MAANDNAMTRFLFAILQQKCLKDIDWNKVAHDPILAQEITNGHAARMRYSRFKAVMLGTEPTRRNRTSTSRVSKPKKKDAGAKASSKSKDASTNIKPELSPSGDHPHDLVKHETSPPPPPSRGMESSSSPKIKDEQQHFHQRMFMPHTTQDAALHRHHAQQQQQQLMTADHLQYMRLMTPSSDSDLLGGSQYAASPVLGGTQTQDTTGYEYHSHGHGHGHHHHAAVETATGEWVSAVGQATAYGGLGVLDMGYDGEWATAAATETGFCDGPGGAVVGGEDFGVKEEWEYHLE
ncbi:hypothetical protein OQA88_12220 [Cercophora sp. LCS_1]